jgi:hypothetical protein
MRTAVIVAVGAVAMVSLTAFARVAPGLRRHAPPHHADSRP